MSSERRLTRIAKDKAIESLSELSAGRYNKSAVDDSRLSIESDDDDNDSVEFQPPKKSKRKNATYSEKATFNTTKSPSQASECKNGNEEEDSSSLYHILLNGKASIEITVDDWIQQYSTDRDAALIKLLQFLIRACGCKGKLTMEMYSSMEHVEIIRSVTEHFDEDSGDYPIIMPGQKYRRFRQSFCDFLIHLVKQCQYSIIYDQFLIDNVVTLLIVLSDSPVRAFRHTGTLAEMKILTALVDVALSIHIQRENYKKQFDTEKQKHSSSKRSSDRADVLSAKLKELEENENEIKTFMNYIFKGVFIHRYRDIFPEIRCICISEMGEWMKQYPNAFLDDVYLKYIGWTLYDKAPECRLACLQALTPLFASHMDKLELFCTRFKSRILSMISDKDVNVAVHAIKLITVLLRNRETWLEEKDCESIYELLFHVNRRIAQAAGEFLKLKLFTKVGENEKRFTVNGKALSENTPFMELFVQFFIESELHEHAAYVVDAMWGLHPMMKDFSCMTDLLLEEIASDDGSYEPFDDQHETCLIEIMVCCVHQASTAEYPIGRGTVNRKLTTKEINQRNDDKLAITEHFLPLLPALISKYITDADKVVNLLKLPTCFNIEILNCGSRDRKLESFLQSLLDVVAKHVSPQIFEACSVCLESLAVESYTFYPVVSATIINIMDMLTMKFKEAFKTFKNADEVDDDDLYPLNIALSKLEAFYRNHYYCKCDFWNKIIYLLQTGIMNADMCPQIIQKCLNFALHMICWSLQRYDPSKEEEELTIIIARSRKLVSMCTELMNHSNETIQEEAFLLTCDILRIINGGIVDCAEENITRFVIFDVAKFGPFLSQFVIKHVLEAENNPIDNSNADEHKNIETLYKRRSMLAGFFKLLLSKVLKIQYAAEIFSYYVKCYSNYGDIFKHALSKLRDISRIEIAKTFANAMTSTYRKVTSLKDSSLYTEEIHHLKELGRRFSLCFGFDFAKSREAIVTIHKEGIKFAALCEGNTYPYIDFLDILSELVPKLTKPDKNLLARFLKGHFEDQIKKGNSASALTSYQNLLLDEPVTDFTIRAKAKRIPNRSSRFSESSESGISSSNIEISLQTPSVTLNPIASSTIGREVQSHVRFTSNAILEEEDESDETYNARSPEIPSAGIQHIVSLSSSNLRKRKTDLSEENSLEETLLSEETTKENVKCSEPEESFTDLASKNKAKCSEPEESFVDVSSSSKQPEMKCSEPAQSFTDVSSKATKTKCSEPELGFTNVSSSKTDTKSAKSNEKPSTRYAVVKS